MKALARIVAESDGRGGTRLTELYGEVPLLPRRTGAAHGGGPAEVHLVGGAAGPLGGDELNVEVHIGPGAALVVRTVAATVALPGVGCSSTRVYATVADGGALDWRPEPIVAARGCDHRSESRVELHAGARLRWREELICGRHDEPCGDLTLATTISRTGVTIFRQDLSVGPRATAWPGPAVLGGARAGGTFVQVGSAWAGPSTVEGGAVMPLAAGDATVVTAVAAHAHELRRALDQASDQTSTAIS